MFRTNDMPIVSRARTAPPAPAQVVALWSRAKQRTVALAKRVYPAVLVLTFFTTALAATIAIRMAIWLPMYLH